MSVCACVSVCTHALACCIAWKSGEIFLQRDVCSAHACLRDDVQQAFALYVTPDAQEDVRFACASSLAACLTTEGTVRIRLFAGF